MQAHTQAHSTASSQDSATQQVTKKVDDAIARLNSAMTTLDKAITKAKNAPKHDTQQEIHLINLDRARLGQELQTLKDEFSSLEGTTSRVIKKLDATIQTLRTVLQDNEQTNSADRPATNEPNG